MSGWAGVFGRLHPALLHLPIGLLAALAAVEAIAVLRRIEAPRPIVSTLAWLTAAAAAFTAATGWVLGLEDGYATDALDRHRWLGLGVAAACLALALLHAARCRAADRSVLRPARWRTAYQLALLAALALLPPAGHFGNALTRGEPWLLVPLRAAATGPDALRPDEPSAAGSSWAGVVAPILAERCAGCHGATKRRGGLALNEPASILAGGKHGPVLVPGRPGESELIRRITLPEDDEDHMPPAGKPQLDAGQIAALSGWVADGATFDGAPLSAGAVPGAAPGAEFLGARTWPAGDEAEPPAADPAALEELRRRFVHVEPLASGSTRLWVDFSAVGAQADDALVARLLDPLAGQVAELGLARTAITDETVALCASMPGLSRLDLSGTAVTDAGLVALSGHPRLQSLLLVDTRLTDASAATLLALPALRSVHVWRSGLGSQAIASLRAQRPALAVEASDTTDSDVIEAEPALSAAAAAGGTPAALAPVNAACPVSGKPVDGVHNVVFDGQVVGFCCATCPTSFWEEPARYADALR